MRTKNEFAKTRPREDPYEVWQSFDGTWTWNVLKKWQVDDDKPYARWFCNVVTPIVPEGEMGDVYVTDIKPYARRLPQCKVCNVRPAQSPAINSATTDRRCKSCMDAQHAQAEQTGGVQ